ncbi:MAG: ribosome biogenesis GTPase Der [Bacteroidetes bacterium]|nr:ribosome biogenesis GTPase Der [Bacteroidota bacterium]
MSNILAIVGRPNVGKSTFFNRLTGEREAIVDPTSGVTRDRNYGTSDWNGIPFSVIDTGGYVLESGDVFEKEIQKQVELAIEEADVILFMVDVTEGVTSMDEDVADLLRRSGKTSYLVVNKVDHNMRLDIAAEFYSLGLGELYSISSMNGSGTGELLDEVVKNFHKIEDEEIPDIPRLAVIGRPNVGKSSLINAILGQERHIVTPVAGTTRDSIFTLYKGFEMEFLLVDTAGLRKKSKVSENLEFYSVMRSIRAIENSDVCLLMLDAKEGIESQDVNILHLCERNHKGVVMVVNKWDLVEKETNTHKDYEQLIREKTAPFVDYPIIFTSVTKKQRVIKALELARDVYEARKKKIPTSKLNETLLPILSASPPPVSKGKSVKVKYITQLPMHYPAFVFFCNLPQYIKESYKRFVENKIREIYDFHGVPISIFFRKK